MKEARKEVAKRVFRFIWTGLEFKKIPKNLDEDVLYVVKTYSFYSSNQPQYKVYWLDRGGLKSEEIPNSIFQQLTFIQFSTRRELIIFSPLTEPQSEFLINTLQPLCSFSDEDIPAIFQGPRKKTPATQHLEFIIKSYIRCPKEVSVRLEEKACFIKIKEFQFNLSAILAAPVCLEQILFTARQLNECIKFFHLKVSKIHRHLYHPVEIAALKVWVEDDGCRRMNDFLRNGGIKGPIEENRVMEFLLIICLAAHALNRPYLKPEKARNLYRGEDLQEGNEVLAERIQAAENRQLIMGKGFTSTSTSKIIAHKFGSEKTYFYEPGGLNPIAKDIGFSTDAFNMECEFTVPPNAEVFYRRDSHDSHRWQANFFRSVNYEQKYHYPHVFSQDELHQIVEELGQLDKREDKEIVQYMPAVDNARYTAGRKTRNSVLLFLMSAYVCYNSIKKIVNENESCSETYLNFLIALTLLSGIISALLAKTTIKCAFGTEQTGQSLHAAPSLSL